jgi:tripartite-type tricarboxylate transporter receptor subunit TctC
MNTTTYLRRSLLQTALAATLGASLAGIAPLTMAQNAQNFPSKPITLIAPWPPGGSSDAIMRAFAESAGKNLGQPVIVLNKPGAGGILGAAEMVNAKPDGYTITQLPLGVFRLPHMQKVSFDPMKDLTYVVCLTGYTFGLAVPADSPFKTLGDAVAYAKANPGKLSYGHTGTGTTPHLAVEEFAQKANIQLLDIPYKGSVEVLTSILGKQIMMMSGTPEYTPHVEAGKLRLLATMGSARTKVFPNVPTVKETGYDTVNESPFGIGAPAGTPPEIVKILHDAFKKTLDDPAVKAKLDQFQQPTIYMNTADYTAYAKRTFAAERATVEKLGLLKK